jgi:NhaA family Na+:H+ antiporter
MLKAAPPPGHLPTPPVRRWTRPFARFLAIESASGFVLLGCTVFALAIANSPWGAAYYDFWHMHLTVTLGSWSLDHSLAHWVNDGLMTIFFFVVGLEIKREIVAGELRDPRKAALPIMAALGGMIAPAAIYYALQQGQPGERGWGIPMATDIAFVVGALALLGPRVPIGLKILLLALAIADDIGAVLVIAIFYSSDLSTSALTGAAIGLFVTLIMRVIGVRSIAVYVCVGIGVWFACLLSGIHPTVAGVVLGLMTPAGAWIGRETLGVVVRHAHGRLDESPDWEDAPDRDHLLEELQTAAREASSPLHRLETALHPWVAFGIMPIFALANAGVVISLAQVQSPVALAVALGLMVGKPVGIFAFSWVAVQIGLARLPAGVNWAAMLGAGCLAGIGFTMSLFVAGLALEGELLEAGKIGTLAGSAVSATLGAVLLIWFLPPQGRNDDLNPAEPV